MPYKNKEANLACRRKWYREHKQEARDYSKKYYRQMRQEVISALGGKCIKCGFSDVRALVIDHVNGGGCKEARNIPDLRKRHLKVLENIKGYGPILYQLLCANCNVIKAVENGEYVGRPYAEAQ